MKYIKTIEQFVNESEVNEVNTGLIQKDFRKSQKGLRPIAKWYNKMLDTDDEDAAYDGAGDRVDDFISGYKIKKDSKDHEKLYTSLMDMVMDESVKTEVNEEMYDFVRDIKGAVGTGNSQGNVENYLGRDLSSSEVRALKQARVIR